MQRKPFPPSTRALTAIAILAAALTALIFFRLRVLDASLAPYGIVQFEFAVTPARADEMIRAWGVSGVAAARESLLLDFAFMPAYALLFASLTLLAARARSGRWPAAGLWLALAPLAAWFFDAVENLALLNLLSGSAGAAALSAALAGAAAVLKFALLAAVLLYLLATGVSAVFRHIGPAR